MNSSRLNINPAELLPHREPMVLIEAIRDWDDSKITCTASSHQQKNNPLRVAGVLSVYAGVEYAAQAMAAHARLVANDFNGEPRKGFLAVASKLSAQVANLDQMDGSLIIALEKIASNDDSSLYHFVISAANQSLLEGQLMAVMEAKPVNEETR